MRGAVWLGFLCLLALPLACGSAAEGESCDLANGNDDCESGLICRPAHEIRASESVCCPRPPAGASSSECAAATPQEFEPDPRVNGSYGTGGQGGGSGGSGGAAGAAGSGGASGAGGTTDASVDAAPDAAPEAGGD